MHQLYIKKINFFTKNTIGLYVYFLNNLFEKKYF